MSSEKKAAFVAVVGRPSVGKSTLVNLLCGAKVAIVSVVPQTTRNAIRGIVNRPEGQLVFVDTPGRHASTRKLNKKLIEVSDRSITDAELVLYVLDASRAPGEEEVAIAARLAVCADKTVAAVNKMDAQGADYEGTVAFLNSHLPGIPASRCLKVSALKHQGAEAIVSCLFDMAGEGPALYPEEYYTDQTLHFRIAEIIREKAINRLRQELPHSLYVEVADAELRDEGKRLWVRAFLITERESQKGMVVGKGGEMIKTIRLAAQQELNRLFDWKVDLDLRVKSSPDWRHNDAVLRRLIAP
ncbi:MAG: GTPase Era [Treponema sp.]|jgi:GTP-binding protein Era|nr:GTPase Era [Treponema sp.]